MRRYLDIPEVTTYLNLGKTMEIFLGRNPRDPEIIHFVDLKILKVDRIEVGYVEVFDEGNLEYLDLYSFSSVDPDKEYETISFDSLTLALNYLKLKFNLSQFNFVNQGVIQYEYEDLLKSEGFKKE